MDDETIPQPDDDDLRGGTTETDEEPPVPDQPGIPEGEPPASE